MLQKMCSIRFFVMLLSITILTAIFSWVAHVGLREHFRLRHSYTFIRKKRKAATTLERLTGRYYLTMAETKKERFYIRLVGCDLLTIPLFLLAYLFLPQEIFYHVSTIIEGKCIAVAFVVIRIYEKTDRKLNRK